MGQSDSGKCYIDDCGHSADIDLPKEFYCGKENGCILCRHSSGERYVCSEHNKKDKYGYGLHFICPNTIAIKKDYYTRSLICRCSRSRNDIYKIKSNYIMIDGYIIHRFHPVYTNVYSREISVDHVDDVYKLYDLTLSAILDLMSKNKDLYFGILPKDIIGIITPYLL